MRGRVQDSLSFGSQTGRTRSGAKGHSSKDRKQKRKKQEFHTHKHWQDQNSEQIGPEAVRARTILALDKLGHQVISTEPGGYDLQDWLRSLNSLLDDFEERLGAERVTEEFRSARKGVVERLVSQPRPQGLEAEIETLVREEETTTRAMREAQKKATAKLSSLKLERETCEAKLKEARKNLQEVKGANKSRGAFSRLFRSGPSTADAEGDVSKLESELRGIEDEIDQSSRAKSRDGGDDASNESLAKIRERLADLQSEVLKSLQLAPERELATKTISAAISSINLDLIAGDGEAR